MATSPFPISPGKYVDNGKLEDDFLEPRQI
jgi:hypothetical protein